VIAAIGANHGIRYAHFDCEKAAINAFTRHFVGVSPLMCVFHEKANLDRQVI
jgi:hypothetical protein